MKVSEWWFSIALWMPALAIGTVVLVDSLGGY